VSRRYVERIHPWPSASAELRKFAPQLRLRRISAVLSSTKCERRPAWDLPNWGGIQEHPWAVDRLGAAGLYVQRPFHGLGHHRGQTPRFGHHGFSMVDGTTGATPGKPWNLANPLRQHAKPRVRSAAPQAYGQTRLQPQAQPLLRPAENHLASGQRPDGRHQRASHSLASHRPQPLSAEPTSLP